MYAIVDIAGQQFKVEKDQKVFVHRLEGKEGSKVEFDKVLLIDKDNKVVVGTPVISGAMVKAEIVDHLKGDKVIVFKKKRRKGYKVKNGHRQYMTQVVIQDILEKGAKKASPKVEEKPVAKKAAAPKTEAKPVAKKASPKAEAKPVAKKEAAKKPAAKTTTAKKPAAKKPAAKTTSAKAETKTAAKKPATKKPAAKKTDDKS